MHGLKHLTLNNMVQDPSFERERLAYQLYRGFGVPAPRAAHVRLRVNGADWGLYLHLESFDRRFLARWFPSNDGMMYEGGPFCDLVPEMIPPGPSEDCFDMEFSTDACDSPSPDQDPTDWELLRELAAQIAALPAGGFYPEVEAFFDFDEFLASFAITALLSLTVIRMPRSCRPLRTASIAFLGTGSLEPWSSTSSTPPSRPLKRMSPTHGSFSLAIASVMYSPMRVQWWSRPSRWMTSMSSQPAAADTALPPEVGVVPPEKPSATASLHMVTASEPMPPDRPLPPVRMSGSRP